MTFYQKFSAQLQVNDATTNHIVNQKYVKFRNKKNKQSNLLILFFLLVILIQIIVIILQILIIIIIVHLHLIIVSLHHTVIFMLMISFVNVGDFLVVYLKYFLMYPVYLLIQLYISSVDNYVQEN